MNKLKEIRERSGRSQAEVAREAGISRESFNALENGRTALYSRHLEPIAKALGVSLAEVVDDNPVLSDSGKLEDIHSYYAAKMTEMEEKYNRELAAKQKELDATRELLDSVKHSLHLTESIKAMLEKQLNSSGKGDA